MNPVSKIVNTHHNQKHTEPHSNRQLNPGEARRGTETGNGECQIELTGAACLCPHVWNPNKVEAPNLTTIHPFAGISSGISSESLRYDQA